MATFDEVTMPVRAAYALPGPLVGIGFQFEPDGGVTLRTVYPDAAEPASATEPVVAAQERLRRAVQAMQDATARGAREVADAQQALAAALRG